MSLSFEELKNSKHIANMYKNKKIYKNVYYNDLNDIEDETKKLTGIKLNEENEIFFPEITDFVEKNQVDNIYITGQTGCGKSTFIKNYIVAFLNKYPQSKIFLFSSKMEDPALDNLPIERVKISDDILKNQISLNDLSSKSKPTLVIFDDIEDFKNSKITKEIERLRDEVMRNGRSYGLFSIFVHHDPCNFIKTKSMIFECSKIVMFPRQCAKTTYDYLMKDKLKLSANIIKKIKNLKSNFVIYSRKLPCYILSDKYILLE